MPATYVPIASTTLNSSQTSIIFGTGGTISQIYTDLVLVMTCVSDTDGGNLIQVGNGSIDTTSSYSITVLTGTGTSATSAYDVSTSAGMNLSVANSTQATTTVMHFMNYSNTTTYKTVISRSGSAAERTRAFVGLWRKTSAINTIKIIAGGTSNFLSGTVATLYGIKAA